MRYQYHLNQEQYTKLWTELNDPYLSNYDNGSDAAIQDRIKLWRAKHQKQFKLSYKELPPIFEDNGRNTSFNEEGHWGTITGSKKHITWFLLHL